MTTWQKIGSNTEIDMNVHYVVESSMGEFIKGVFQDNYGVYFQSIKYPQYGRLILKFSDIQQIYRLNGDKTFPCPHCNVISLDPTKNGVFPLRGCDNDICATQWWNRPQMKGII